MNPKEERKKLAATLKTQVGHEVNKTMSLVKKELESVQKAHKDARKNVRETHFEDAVRYSNMMIDPETAPKILRTPDLLAPRCSIFKDTIIVTPPVVNLWDPNTASPSSGGRKYVVAIAAPNPSSPLYVATDSMPEDTFQMIVTSQQLPENPGSSGSQWTTFAASWAQLSVGGATRVLQAQVGPGGYTYYGVGLTFANNSTSGLYLSGLSEYAQAQVSLITYQGGIVKSSPWTAANASTPTISGAQMYSGGMTSPITNFGLAIRLVSNTNVPYFVPGFVIANGLGTTVIGNTTAMGMYQTYTGTVLPSMVKYSRARVNSLSLLTSFFGSTLNNGGKVSAARLTSGIFSADGADMMSYAATRPFDCYDGRLETGSYVWWLPTSLDEIGFSNPGSSYDYANGLTTTLVSVAYVADTTQPLRLKTTFTLEVETDSPLYDSRFSEYNPMFYEMLHYLRAIPAATENPWHDALVGFFDKVVSKARELGSDPDNWIKLGKAASVFLPGPLSLAANAGLDAGQAVMRKQPSQGKTKTK